MFFARLQVVGHSQGMSALYVMLSNYPSMANNISLVGLQSFKHFASFTFLESFQCFLFVHTRPTLDCQIKGVLCKPERIFTFFLNKLKPLVLT